MAEAKIKIKVYAIDEDSKHWMSSSHGDLKKILQQEAHPIYSSLFWIKNPDFKGTFDTNLIEIKNTGERINLSVGVKSNPVYSAIIELPQTQFEEYKKLIEEEGRYKLEVLK